MTSSDLPRHPARLGGVSTVDAPDAAAGPDEQPAPAGGELTLGEALVVGAVLLLGMVAWAGLALAHASRWSLPAAVGIGAAATAVLLAVLWRPRLRPRLRVDRRELVVLAGLAVVAALLFVPGFPYGLGDKDPGTYVSHGAAIARTGSWRLEDPVLDRSRVGGFQPSSPGARLPGLWYDDPADGVVTVQFYHLWPAALAVGWAAAGPAGLVLVGPLFGVLAVLAVALAVRRSFGLLAGGLAGLLLAGNMLEVWQAKYPSAEIITQALVAAALLGLLVALRTGWRPAAGLAGLLLGIAWLARADTLLLVLIAVAAGCVLIVLGRADGRMAWFAGGLAVVTPHALLQAYGFADRYTLANHVPGLPVVAALVVGGLALAVLARRLARPLWDRLDAALAGRRLQVAVGLLVTVAAGGAMLLGFLRPLLFGPAYFNYHGNLIRSFDEQTMRRLSWFMTLPGMGLAGLGLAVVALRRWSAAAWTAVLPVLLVLPVYAAAAENSSRLLWWNRRFVPVVLPGLLTLIVVALVAALAWNGRLRVPLPRAGGALVVPARLAPWLRLLVRLTAAGLAVFMLVVFASQSLPLRGHREYDGSFEVTRRIAATAGDRQGVYLFGRGPGIGPTAFAVPVWLQEGQVAVLLRPKPNAAYVQAFQRGFPGQPVFLVTAGAQRPAGYDTLELRQVERVTAELPMWDESDERRPDRAHLEPVDLSIWQVQGT